MRKLLWVVLLLGLAGCKSGGANGEGQTKKNPPPIKKTVFQTGHLKLQNTSTQVIFRVRFMASSASEWGMDRLTESDLIKAKHARSWEIQEGSYKVMVEFGDGGTWESPEPVVVPAKGTVTCVVAGSEPEIVDGTLTIHNASPWGIASIKFSLSTEMGYGDERLDSNELLKANSKRSWPVPPGKYQLKIEFQDGTLVESSDPAEVLPREEKTFTIRPPG